MKLLLISTLICVTTCYQITQSDIEYEASKQLQEKEDCKDAAKTLNLQKSKVVRPYYETPYCFIYTNDNDNGIAVSLSESRFMIRLDNIKKSLKMSK